MSERVRELETLELVVSAAAAPLFEAAMAEICRSVGRFREEPGERWRIEGIRAVGAGEEKLALALALAAAVSGEQPELRRIPTPASGWLARNRADFPEQMIGERFALRGTHLPPGRTAGRITLMLDAGLAFGSGEHGSTRGCLIALERLARRHHPRRILDLGTGSGILAMAAARLFHRRVLASDIDPWSVRVAAENARRNFLARRITVVAGDGWRKRPLRHAAPFDLVFANILARPLCAMAGALAQHLAPGGTAILAGLLSSQEAMVLAAHRRAGLILTGRVRAQAWTTLILRRPCHAR